MLVGYNSILTAYVLSTAEGDSYCVSSGSRTSHSAEYQALARDSVLHSRYCTGV